MFMFMENQKEKNSGLNISTDNEPEKINGELNLQSQNIFEDKTVELEKLISQLQTEVTEKNDAYLRAKAETDNVRRRAIEERAKVQKFAIENFVIDLLPVYDALQSSINNKDIAVEKLLEGVSITQKMLLNVFEKNFIKEIPALGEKFNPNIHEAMGMEEADAEEGVVMRVFQSGYQLNGRLIRPARVVIAKKKG